METNAGEVEDNCGKKFSPAKSAGGFIQRKLLASIMGSF